MSADLCAVMAENIARVQQRVERACERAGRAPTQVAVVAVSKTRTIAEIVAAYRCGLRHFGENRIEEAETKIPAVRGMLGPEPATWHMVGHLQGRKARRAVELVDTIDSVDTMSLAVRLERLAAEREVRLPVLLEVNVSGELAKSGFPAWDEESRSQLCRDLAALEGLAHISVRGLMTMAPLVQDAESVRHIFRATHELAAMLRGCLPFSTWDELSMGMTNDYVVAIEEGATMVRIGRAIFEPQS